MKTFIFTWKTGSIQETKAESITEAFKNLGLDLSEILHLDSIKDIEIDIEIPLGFQKTIFHRTCKTCRKPFTFSRNEADWLTSNNLKLFTRCRKCRRDRRTK